MRILTYRELREERKLKKIFREICSSVKKIFEGDFYLAFEESAERLYGSYYGCFLKIEIGMRNVKWSIGIVDSGVSPLFYRESFNSVIIRKIVEHYPSPVCIGTSNDMGNKNDVQIAADLFNKFMTLVDVLGAMVKERDDVIAGLIKSHEDALKDFEKKVAAYNLRSFSYPQKKGSEILPFQRD
jgi:hypothetical protein